MSVHQTLSWLKSELYKRNIRPNKKRGQNFLIDINILNYVTDKAKLNKDDIVLEIGTGTAALTQLLAERAKTVVTFEIDSFLYEFAKENLAFFDNVVLINKDAMKNKSTLEPQIVTEIQQLLNPSTESDNNEQSNSTLKLVSNLPYAISTPIIINILESELPVELMVLTLQKEITTRLLAKPGTRDYGILSIIAQYFSKVEILKYLPPDVFWPNPKIDSAIVKMRIFKDEERLHLLNYKLFTNVIRSIFSSRRKTINNSLMKLEIISNIERPLSSILEELGIAADVRGETLTIEQLVNMSNTLHKAMLT